MKNEALKLELEDHDATKTAELEDEICTLKLANDELSAQLQGKEHALESQANKAEKDLAILTQ